MNEVNPTNQTKYWKISQDCLKGLDMLEDQNHKILNAPYKIRNTLHNNGFHYDKYDFEIMLRRKTYKFVSGSRIDFAGWDDLYVFFDELMNLLIKIVNNSILQKIKFIPQTSHLN